MKKLLAFGAVLASLWSGTTFAETLRFSSFEPPQAYVTSNILTPWAEKVAAASKGTLEIQMFAGGTLGRNPAQQLKLVEDGVADIAWVIPGYTPGRFDGGTVAELPFMVTESHKGSLAMWKMVADGHFKGDYEKFKLLCVCVSIPAFIGATKEIKEPKDMSGLKMRAPGPTQLAVLEALGAVPIGGITAATLAESISRGLISGSLIEWVASETFSADQVLTHYNTAALGATPMLVLMNKARYEALPAEAREAIDQYSGEAFSDYFGQEFDRYAASTRERIVEKHKPQVIDPDEAAVESWKAALVPATEKWIAARENGQAIYDAFGSALQAVGGAE